MKDIKTQKIEKNTLEGDFQRLVNSLEGDFVRLIKKNFGAGFGLPCKTLLCQILPAM